MKEFETERLKLIKPNQKYLEDFYHYAKKPNIGPMAGWPPHQNIAESKFILEEMAKSDKTWSIIWKETDTLIGTIDLRPVDSFFVFKTTSYELGYAIDDEYWGRGIVVEAANLLLDYAFNELRVKEVIVGHGEQNLQSKRVIEKLGFVFEKAEYEEQFRTYTNRMWRYKMSKYDYERRNIK